MTLDPDPAGRRAVLLGKLAAARLYAILDTGYVPLGREEEVLQALLEGGAGIVQLRAKGWTADNVAGLAARLLPLTRSAGIPFIVNDHPEVAAATGADGVHLGQDDGSLAGLRAATGPVMLAGRSTHSPAQAVAAAAEGFDYLGFGPLFATPTKPGRPAIGLAGIAPVLAASSRPVFCIGGINPLTLQTVLAAGAQRVVVVSALLQAPDIRAACRTVLAALPAQ
jgi:thiamine-phosphate pyrophosphorylase